MAKTADMTTATQPPRAPGTTGAEAPRDALAPGLHEFLSGSDHRLRDLLAYGMAVEANRPLSREGVEELRRAAEAELDAHAFRTLHNQAEAIRRQAADEQLARLPRGLSFTGVVAANLVAVALGVALLLLALLVAPAQMAGLLEQVTQLLARAATRS